MLAHDEATGKPYWPTTNNKTARMFGLRSSRTLHSLTKLTLQEPAISRP